MKSKQSCAGYITSKGKSGSATIYDKNQKLEVLAHFDTGTIKLPHKTIQYAIKIIQPTINIEHKNDPKYSFCDFKIELHRLAHRLCHGLDLRLENCADYLTSILQLQFAYDGKNREDETDI